jgi:hypothetical protein
MRIFSLVENVLMKLAGIPGLQFLSSYVREFHYRQTNVQQSVSKYKGYVHSARGAAAEVKGACKTEQSSDDEEEEIEEEDDEFETFMQ